MTTVAFKDGIMAADSRFTMESEAGGARVGRCEKLYRKWVGAGRKRHEVIIGTSGESSPALIFVDWYGSDKEPPKILSEMAASFDVMLYSKYGLFSVDGYCRPEKLLDRFWAVGSGSKAALGAMHAGASAREAVAIACRIDPFSAPPVTWMTLDQGTKHAPLGGGAASRPKSAR